MLYVRGYNPFHIGHDRTATGMLQLTQIVAVLASTLFAGAALYVSLVEHPARLSCGTELAVVEFGPSYKRATVMQVALALVAAVAGVVWGLLSGGAICFVGAAAIFASIPFTLVFMLPVNNRILDPARDRTSPETRALLERWGRMHAVRTIVSFAASLLFIAA
jgi:uncharacterized membrane protein